jgi:hypothetical protein
MTPSAVINARLLLGLRWPTPPLQVAHGHKTPPTSSIIIPLRHVERNMDPQRPLSQPKSAIVWITGGRPISRTARSVFRHAAESSHTVSTPTFDPIPVQFFLNGRIRHGFTTHGTTAVVYSTTHSWRSSMSFRRCKKYQNLVHSYYSTTILRLRKIIFGSWSIKLLILVTINYCRRNSIRNINKHNNHEGNCLRHVLVDLVLLFLQQSCCHRSRRRRQPHRVLWSQ